MYVYMVSVAASYLSLKHKLLLYATYNSHT